MNDVEKSIGMARTAGYAAFALGLFYFFITFHGPEQQARSDPVHCLEHLAHAMEERKVLLPIHVIQEHVGVPGLVAFYVKG